jgi:hypothetical protein
MLLVSLGSAKHPQTDPRSTALKATSRGGEPHFSRQETIDADITMKKNETLLEADISSSLSATKRQRITDMHLELDSMSAFEVPMS